MADQKNTPARRTSRAKPAPQVEQVEPAPETVEAPSEPSTDTAPVETVADTSAEASATTGGVDAAANADAPNTDDEVAEAADLGGITPVDTEGVVKAFEKHGIKPNRVPDRYAIYTDGYITIETVDGKPVPRLNPWPSDEVRQDVFHAWWKAEGAASE